MEVILTQDVIKLGKRGDVVKVKDGYARNFLFPRSLALLASDSNKRHFTEVMRQTRARMEKQKSTAEELRAKLDGEHIKLTLAFGETGKAYGSITAKEIAVAFREKGLYFDHHQVILDHPLKEAGAHDVQVRIFGDVVATVKVWIVPEGEPSSPSSSPSSAPSSESIGTPQEEELTEAAEPEEAKNEPTEPKPEGE